MTASWSCVAIDFETADAQRDSACAMGLVKVRDGQIIDSRYGLIRPPRSQFSPFCSRVHGLRWRDVKNSPNFRDFWIQHAGFLEGVDFLAAHNANFDSAVLRACCDSAQLPVPSLPFVCTVELARSQWNLRPTKLPDVCQFLGLDLSHHHALSDAQACAQIVMAAVASNPSVCVRLKESL